MKTTKQMLMLLLFGAASLHAQTANNIIYNTPSTSTPGAWNTVFGSLAGTALGNTGSPFANVFVGTAAGANSTGSAVINEGNHNVFVGASAGNANTTGFRNSVVGAGALSGGTTTTGNCVLGFEAMILNTGSNNVAIGGRAMGDNVPHNGGNNIAIGTSSLLRCNSNSNVAVGFQTGLNLTTGQSNAFFGDASGPGVTTGNRNTFLGQVSGSGIATGSANTFVGPVAASTDVSNTVVLADGDGAHRYYNVGNATGINLGNNVIPLHGLDVRGNMAVGDATYTGATGTLTNGMIVQGRMGIGTTTPTNKVEITAESGNASGLKFTNLNSGNTPVSNPGTGVLSLNSNGDVILVNDATSATPNDDWKLAGNDPASGSFLGTTNASGIPLALKSQAEKAGLFGATNTAIGQKALNLNTSGDFNTAVGVQALASLNNAAADNNTAVGYQAGQATTTGNTNVFIGNNAGYSNTTGSNNIFIGNRAGRNVSSSWSNKLLITNTDASAASPLIYGELDNKIFKVNADFNSSSRVEITSATTGVNGTSGLKFTNLTDTNNAAANTTNKFLTVDSNGNVVLETLASSVTDDLSIYTSDHAIEPVSGPGSGLRTVTMGDNNLFFDTSLSDFVDGTVGTGRIYIGSTPNNFPVLAATPSDSHYRLLVEGGILTEKVKVAVSGTLNWADYVFADDYRLMPLKEVESFVKANKHLPGIESSEELQQSGLDLADMQRKQMEKIEELTLHLINQNKTIEKQNQQINALETRNQEIDVLKAQMKTLLEQAK